jgi:hypothetical protein
MLERMGAEIDCALDLLGPDQKVGTLRFEWSCSEEFADRPRWLAATELDYGPLRPAPVFCKEQPFASARWKNPTMPTLQFEQTLARSDGPASFWLATGTGLAADGLEVDRYLATLPAGTKVEAVTFFWTEIAQHPPHAVWAARTELVLEAGQGTR